MASVQNKEILRTILPENYNYHIHGISVIRSGEHRTEVQLEAHFRVNVDKKENFDIFLKDFSKCTGTSYNKGKQIDRSGPRASLFGIRKCIHHVKSRKKDTDLETNKNGNKTGKSREPGKNTNCKAEIAFSIANPCDVNCTHKNMDNHNLKKE